MRIIEEVNLDEASLKILMVTSEVVPFAKAGGLGDMVAALSAELQRQGHDVRIFLPRYYSIDVGRMQRINGPLGVPLGETEEWCATYLSRLPDAEVPVYFLDHEILYGRDGIYGARGEPGFADNLQRFALLSRGAFQICRALDWFPDVMHSHDWPSALVPVCLNAREREGEFADTGSMLTIHNLGHQGVFPKEDFRHLPVSPDLYTSAGFFENRVALQATAITPWGDLRIISTHLTHGDPAVNEAQAASLIAFVDDNASGSAPSQSDKS